MVYFEIKNTDYDRRIILYNNGGTTANVLTTKRIDEQVVLLISKAPVSLEDVCCSRSVCFGILGTILQNNCNRHLRFLINRPFPVTCNRLRRDCRD